MKKVGDRDYTRSFTFVFRDIYKGYYGEIEVYLGSNTEIINGLIRVRIPNYHSFIFLRKGPFKMAKGKGVQTFILKSQGFVRKNSPTILTIVGTGGVVVTAVMAAKATPKALLLLENAKQEKGDELTKIEKLKVAGPVYIPSALVGAATISCIVGANVLNKRQQTALASAYAALNATHKEHKAKVEEMLGEGTNAAVEKEIAQDKYDENKPEPEKDGETLFYDEYSKRFFNSTLEKVQRAQYYLNRNLSMRDYAYLNEWYDELGLEEVPQGYELGWSTGACFDYYWQPWIDFINDKATLDDGREYYIIRMLTEPIMDFESYC